MQDQGEIAFLPAAVAVHSEDATSECMDVDATFMRYVAPGTFSTCPTPSENTTRKSSPSWARVLAWSLCRFSRLVIPKGWDKKQPKGCLMTCFLASSLVRFLFFCPADTKIVTTLAFSSP